MRGSKPRAISSRARSRREDDPFDTIEQIGRDYPRLEYMARLLKFTKQQKNRRLRGEA